MSLKSFFIVDPLETVEANAVSVQKTVTPVTSFPMSNAPIVQAPIVQVATFPSVTSPAATSFTPIPSFSSAPINNEHLEKIIDVYDKRFASLNKPGYDFYEFFMAVLHAGIDNPQVYAMAMSMAVAMDSTVTKESLCQQADFYIDEIDKIHTQFTSDGQTKMNNLSTQKTTETQSLTADIQMLNEQLLNIQEQLGSRTQALAQIDAKYLPDMSEIGAKLNANDTAKERLSISLVKVKTNLSSL